ncbi:uncharacterized protein LOC118440634 isoform X1 [Vespa mandarinia]|uniref:uncharacterized protein LOC118440634 isoform X1 n=2 Tax=Vespa mandarinia TaxID=7446 RepID=UPI001613537F|nr:uncharacterized protein LOC118440634 isoform X1 [Vespa mandarinia]XP_035719848.1 uncharacterized protein LOC118440634 isoform X1 [Vespa mandarinia]
MCIHILHYYNMSNKDIMFATKQNLKTTLLHGPAELSKTFLYEAAIYWAEEGHRVFYITPIPLQQIPSACHESNPSTYFTYKLITFVYLSNYKSLVTQLAELHTFVSLPTIVLLDDLDHYIKDDATKKQDYCQEKTKMRIARACSVIFDAINSCSRISNTIVHACVWSSSILRKTDMDITIYFRNIWNVSEDEENKIISLKKIGRETHLAEGYPSFEYYKFQDGTRILKNVYREFLD